MHEIAGFHGLPLNAKYAVYFMKYTEYFFSI